ncbi:MAG: cysteine--tRNA ligase [Candidatus Woesearchaeota archaeon]
MTENTPEIMLFNTMGRKKELFVPIKRGHVGIYSCGPTVYNYAHIGNLMSYVFSDTLKRTFLYNGFKVKHVINITDVGHLTSDADEGEDKMEKGAKREGKTVWEVAEFYTKAFKDDFKALNIIEPDIWCKATDHINEMIEINMTLEKKGFTYFAGGNLYFDISKFKDYGKLALLNIESLKAGARIDVDENKKNPHDFALWFTKSKFENQAMIWESPWGKGYPGWHIECSAMSSKYLGEHFDIHTGGIDHIPVHHTNEIAQAEAAFGHKWVNWWMHNEFLVINKGKMAKSGENFLRLQALIDKGYDPLAYRYFLLNGQYRQQLMFSFEALDSAKNGYENLKGKIIELKKRLLEKSDDEEHDDRIAEYKEQFLKAINDDLNTPQALAVLWTAIKDDGLNNKEKLALAFDFDRVFGLRLEKAEEEKIEVADEIKELIEQRNNAKKEKDWKTADSLREEIKAQGFILEDTKQGTTARKA